MVPDQGVGADRGDYFGYRMGAVYFAVAKLARRVSCEPDPLPTSELRRTQCRSSTVS
jgi:hypothetical protein